VYNARMNSRIKSLHGALIDLVGLMNQPQRDVALIREAGISLDRALFPLLVFVERAGRTGPVGIVDLAALVGRDHTTVSRQVSKLQQLGLVSRKNSAVDKRSRSVVITTKGRKMTDALDAARERLAGQVLEKWTETDLEQLVKLMRRFADDLNAWHQ
jgi:DNA-binding MarR family transcriptional regulator